MSDRNGQPVQVVVVDDHAIVRDGLAAGRSNDAIAREICLSGTTVRNVASSIYGKLHAAHRAEAITAARGRSAAGPGGRPTDR